MDCLTKWTVKLEGVYPGTEDDFILSFTDVRDILPQLSLKRYVIQDISDLCGKKANYCELPNVKEVASDTGEKLASDRTAVLLATLKGKKKMIGILLYLLDEMTYEVRGIRGDDFVREVGNNGKKITDILSKITQDPDEFDDVNLVVPESRF